ncbi:MAG: 50S ribosomal protein L10 [Candidatus Aureabacteria bacterium]|nr:50S ribosomal protein L10 [Candidatus Auribacterota bacterium]MCK5160189.1 50S ribosomal protein L10 [Candidatus Auribacterota bacterium]
MRPEKRLAVKEIKQKLEACGSFVLADYVGLTVEEMNGLRNILSGNSVNFMVVKNRLFNITAKELGIEGLEKHLKGPTAVAFLGKDVAAGAKILVDFNKKTGKLELKAGILDEKLMDHMEIKTLAELPSREVLLGIVAGTIQAPIASFARVLNAKLSSVVYAINAIREKKVKLN